MIFLNGLFIGIHALLGGGFTNGLKRRVKDFSSFGMRTPGRGQAVNHQINLTQISLNGVNDFGLHLVRESIAVKVFAVQALGLGQLLKRRRVIPARGTRFFLGALFFKEHTKGASAAAKGRGDARGQPVTR